MKDFMKGILALWTVLTTVWAFISLQLISGMIEGVAEQREKADRRRERVSYKSYHEQ